jgi:micrococcal nuclease
VAEAMRAAFIVFFALLAASAQALTALPDFTSGGAVEIAQVLDGDSVRLADGRELRLVSIDAPPAGRGREATLAARAKAALEQLVVGESLELRLAGTASDRRGRVVGELFAGGRWVQRELVQRGLARVRGEADNRLGLAELLAAEASARAARRGIWALAEYDLRRADETARYAGTFQLVEGTVVDAARVEGGIRLNFGPDWHTAFNLRISAAALKLWRAAGLDPMTLKGARLRVRGFIDGTNRPTIEVTYPEQIERL